jgi:hypothetical protein
VKWVANLTSSILEGVRAVRNKVRIATQLVEVTDGYQPSEEYDRRLDIFAVQDGVPQTLSAPLTIRFRENQKGPLKQEHGILVPIGVIESTSPL